MNEKGASDSENSRQPAFAKFSITEAIQDSADTRRVKLSYEIDHCDLDRCLRVLWLVSKPCRANLPNGLQGWEDFPFEALLANPTAATLRKLQNSGDPCAWLEPGWIEALPEVEMSLDEIIKAWRKDQKGPSEGNGTDRSEEAAQRQRTDGEGDGARKQNNSSKGRRLGIIGSHLYRALRSVAQGSDEPESEFKFWLQLERRRDLRIIRLGAERVDDANTNGKDGGGPPFAYVGEWSDDISDAHSTELTAAATLWKNPDLRRYVVESWQSRIGGQDSQSHFLFGFPPLSHYILKLHGKAKQTIRDHVREWTFQGDLDISLPHLVVDSIITTLPSYVVLRPATQEPDPKRSRLRPLAMALGSLPSSMRRSTKAGAPERESLLVASPHLRTAVGELAALWADAKVRTVLFIAPPGSGKEVIVRFLHSGISSYGPDAHKTVSVRLQEASLVGMSVEDVRKTIFGEIDCPSDFRENLKRRIVKSDIG